jgi:hypothetical protein
MVRLACKIRKQKLRSRQRLDFETGSWHTVTVVMQSHAWPWYVFTCTLSTRVSHAVMNHLNTLENASVRRLGELSFVTGVN